MNIEPGLHDRLTELEQLQEDWDGYGAYPISTAAMQTARFLASYLLALDELNPEGITMPYPVPNVDGGIQFDTNCNGQELEIYIDAFGGLAGWHKGVGSGETEF